MPLEVFFSYSHRDEDLRDELEKHLSLLDHSGLIAGWHDRRIDAGAEWSDEIDSHARSAQIILLLISSDFLASEYCYGVETKLALERHRKREAVVIPIILRPVDWAGAPFAFLQALPRNARPVTSWTSRDEALADVARGIREMIARLRPPETPADDHAFPRDTMKPGVVDAAIPSHIVKDRATELLVLIRLPESAGLRGVLADEDSEAGPEEVRSRPFSISFPVGPKGLEPLKVAVNITSPDFAPAQQTKSLMVPVGRRTGCRRVGQAAPSAHQSQRRDHPQIPGRQLARRASVHAEAVARLVPYQQQIVACEEVIEQLFTAV